MLPENDFTLGVEEEYLLVDPGSRELVPASRAVLAHSQPALGEPAVQHELYLAQALAHTCHAEVLQGGEAPAGSRTWWTRWWP
jgi:gamma-glutamyl:cysteine ligase YbdK (ATP-grasp superfamily)